MFLMSWSYFVRYIHDDECHLYQSTTLSADTCENIGGIYVAANHTCYHHEYSCPYYNVGGQCHPNVLCNAFSCDTCHLYGGYHEPRTGWYVTTYISIYYVHKLDARNGGTRHLPPPRRRTRQLLSGSGGCARGKPPVAYATATAVSEQSQRASYEPLSAVAEREDSILGTQRPDSNRQPWPRRQTRLFCR